MRAEVYGWGLQYGRSVMMYVLLCSPLITSWIQCAQELVLPGAHHLLWLLSPPRF